MTRGMGWESNRESLKIMQGGQWRIQEFEKGGGAGMVFIDNYCNR